MMLLDTTSDFQTALRRATSLGTGCLVVDDATGTRSGRIFLRDGRVYSVLVDGFLPKIAQRLRTGGMVDDDGLRNLLAECGNDPYASDAGEKAVIAGMVGSDVLQAVHRELLLSSIGAMRAWDEPRVKFKRQVETARFVISAVSVEAILRALDRRAERWAALWREIAPGAAVEDVFPRAAREPADPSDSLSFEAEAVAAVADGTRSVDEVAGECGLTRFETGHVLAELVTAGRASISYVAGADTDADTGSGEAADRSTPAVPPADGGQPVSPEAYLEVPSPGRRPEVTVSTAEAEPSATGCEDRGSPVGHEPATGPEDAGPDHVDPPAGPVIYDHADDDELQGPRLAPDVLAANEHVGDLQATDEGDTHDHDDLPAWGDPVDDLPDGLYFEPVAIDMPDVVFEAVADGVSNRSTEAEAPAEQPDGESGDESGNGSGNDSAAPGSGDPHPEPVGGSAPPEGPREDAPPAAVTEEASSTAALAVPTGPADLVAALEVPDAMPALDTTSQRGPEAGAAGSTEEPGHGGGAMLPLAPPMTAAGAARWPDISEQAGTADSGSSRTPAGEDAGALAAAEAERIAAAEAVRVEAEAQAEDRDERRAALDRAQAALTAAQAEADRSEIACEELLTSRTRVEESVDRLVEAVTVAEDELRLLEVAAAQALERLQHVAAAEDEARADLAGAEAALAAARAAHEAAVDRLAATASSRADLDVRAELAAADHRQATERSARLKAEEQLARDAAAVSVKAHAAAVMLAAAARDSVAEAALRVERARSRLEELD